VLNIIGNAVRSPGEIGERQYAFASGHGRHSLDIESGTKGPTFTRQHHGAHARNLLETRADLGEGFEHGRIERIHFVRPIEPDVGDAIRYCQVDAILHAQSP
jgi:hypothetical protein